VHHEAFDISDEDAVMAFAHRTLEAGPVDVVMNVAGISTRGASRTCGRSTGARASRST
jgi:NAD(P)-dependent dehydrogenase (short-subunit alcohol dehydrogenase family)